MKKAISTLLFSLVVLSAFSQWYWVNPAPIGADLSDVVFTDNNTGYAVGEAGTIIKTIDNGESWEFLSSGKLVNYTMIRFTDEQTAYVAGSGGFLMKTTDAGENWTELETNLTQTPADMYFIDNNTGFICGGFDELLKTTDGGLTWYNVCPEMFYASQINSIYFPTSLIGYAAANLGTVLKTTDGGETWTESIHEPRLDLKKIFFVNADTGFVAGESGYFAVTHNGGAYWDYHNSPVITASKLFFKDYLTGYAIEGGHLMKTTNSGNTWSSVGMNEIGSFFFNSDNNVFGVGFNGRIFKSEDGGVTSTNYTTTVTEERFVDLQFPDANTGYAITDLPGQIIKTTDAGNSWKIIDSSKFNRLYSVWFTDALTGFVTNGVGLYKSTDGGYNWTEITGTEWNGYLQHIMFVNPLVGYITGESNGVIYKTIDGGTTWVELYNNEFEWPRNLHFLNENLGYFAKSYSVLKTTDGGQSFSEFMFPNDNLFLSIYFPTENTGFVGGFGGRLYRTTNGGQSWIRLGDTSNYYPIIDMFFVNENIGYMCSDKLYQTNDSGKTWVEISFIHNGTSSIWFTDELNGYVVGGEGDIFKTVNAGAVSTNNPVKPKSFYTVYPNPTDGLVTIDNDHKSSEPLQVSVYNTIGNLIYKNQYTEPVIQIDLRDYPSGMYFIKISGNGRNEVMKVINQ